MATGAGSRGPYAKTVLIRERITAAAMDVFAESGFRAGTMKNIAERAGISQRGLVHHFATKEELLSEVLAARAAESSRMMHAGTPVEVLESVIEIMVDNARRPRLIELHSALSAEATAIDHPAHAHHAQLLQAWRLYLTEVFTELESQGALLPGMRPDIAAATLVAVQDGIQIQWLYDPHLVDMARVVTDYITAVAPGIIFRHPAQK
ncbi:TetR/AcrR family transcriptional regulator [Glaciihabitans sp. UYNi722]|uniref:TetR/AcrR family transcriptional regulator n=1 Tax=Glaciihabitans sp. UYNi722 TaxID=3156344 RepID=UPI003390CB19